MSLIAKMATVAIHLFLLLLAFLFDATQSIARPGLANFGSSVNDLIVPTGDDTFALIQLPSQLKYFGSNYTRLYVATNGAISLGDDLATFISFPFPLARTDEPLIAPFFADVDTRGIGTVYYRLSTNANDINFANNKVRNGFAHVHSSFSASQVIIATWDSVGYFNRRNDKNNTFQCVLAWNEVMSFAIFLYVEDLQWTTGDVNGGFNGLGGDEAQVGFDSGNGSHFNLPVSGTPDVLSLDTTSNVNVSGVWVFRIDESSGVTNGSIVDCGIPTLDPLSSILTGNSSVTFTSTLFGSTATYMCNDGFTLSGNAVRTCTSNGVWSPVGFTCTPADCGSPDLPMDTTALTVSNTSTAYNGVATYSCETGYVLDGGQSTRVCQSNSTWSGVAPHCNLMACNKSLLFPANTTSLFINAPRTTFGSVATYTCSPGYAVRNNTQRTCLANGQWSLTPSVCELVNCGEPDLGSNPAALAFTTTSTFLDGVATYSCQPGYENLIGNIRRVCLDGIGWNGTAPSCSPVDCGSPPPTILDGIIHVDPPVSTTFGSTVHYSCIFGYKLVGVNPLMCLANGTWSGQPPTCQLITCGTPIDHTDSQLQVTDNGTIAMYTCANGYTLNGNSIRTCSQSGEWNGQPPTCQIVDCGSLTTGGSVTGGLSVSLSNTTFNSVATYSCSTGYRVIGERTRTCMSNGTWSSVQPQCQLINCGNPEGSNFTEDTNINVTVTSTLFGGIATYICLEEGTVVVGNMTRTCGMDENWTGVSPTDCQLVDCGVPDRPLSGFGGLEITYDNTTYNETAFYNCTDSDLTLIGDEERVCQANGRWSGEVPYCQRREHSFVIGISVGVTIAVVVLFVFFLLLLLLLFWIFLKLRKSSKKPLPESLEENDYVIANKNPPHEDPFINDEDIDSVHDFTLQYLKDEDGLSVYSDKLNNVV